MDRFGVDGSPEASTEEVPKAFASTSISAFLRMYQLRAPQVMWLLGAGASRTAGIKTAGDIIWDCKQRLYRSEKKLPPSAITDIGEPAVRRKLQAHFDAQGDFPAPDAEDEYSAYFEATYPSPKDRRVYLDDLVKKGKPSFGHAALALLMREKLCKMIWTTNFDRTIEDAAAHLSGGTGWLVTGDLGEPQKVRQAIAEARWPIYGKLHGDFQSESLKNTNQELRSQDAEMRKNLIDGCRRNGLAVVGYSGRDVSVMDALEEALDDGRGFPNGLFWFKRSGEVLYNGVTDLLKRAMSLGVEAYLVEAESFDELFSDIVRFLPETADKVRNINPASRVRLASAPLRTARDNIPAIRTNALCVTAHPALCRVVDCTIGGQRDVIEAVALAGVDIDAARTREGVLAFGRDADVRKAFDPFTIRSFDFHPLSSGRLVKENGERSLVRDALFRSIGRRPGLSLMRRGRRYFIVPDSSSVKPDVFTFDGIRPVGKVAGKIPGTTLDWTEACGVRLDYRLDQLWLLLDPTILADVPKDTPDAGVEAARDYVRERQVLRRNKEVNALLEGWIGLVVGQEKSVMLRAFGIGDGVDAEFEVLRTSGFSGRAGK